MQSKPSYSRFVPLGIALLMLVTLLWVSFAPGVAPRQARVVRVLERLDQRQAQPRRPKLTVLRKDATSSPVAAALARGLERTPGPLMIGKLAIPKIDLQTRIYSGVGDAVLVRGPGLWPGTARPGDTGNAVLSGHRTTHTRPFAKLGKLRKRDRILIEMTGDSQVAFKVFDTAVVTESRYQRAVLRKPSRPHERTLTLFACHPRGDRTHRILVRARARTLPQALLRREDAISLS